MMPDPNQLNADDLTGRNSVVVAGFDELTGQSLYLRCLHGAYVDRVCSAQVYEDSVASSFFLPLGEIDQWRDRTARVKTLFQSLRVE